MWLLLWDRRFGPLYILDCSSHSPLLLDLLMEVIGKNARRAKVSSPFASYPSIFQENWHAVIKLAPTVVADKLDPLLTC